MITIQNSLKKYTADADKAVTPQVTVDRATAAFAEQGREILSQLRRIDTGRLDIPVYLSICGEKAREVMPTRKQMGKGSSPVQAKASALMELAERFSYFSFISNPANFHSMTWNEASSAWPHELIPITEIIKSVNEDISPSQAEQVLSLVTWQFTRATCMGRDQEFYIPYTWFKKLNEFNGCSAGNTFEESILQGGCELIERHCCALIDSRQDPVPTIDLQSAADPVLKELLDKFAKNNIKVWLKDFTLDMPAPTVGALAYDPANFPGLSEIVYTAGTATSPTKAAVRALTEIAQLAGDFHSGSNYEASGLPKYTSLDQIKWLTRGPAVSLDSLPDISHPDMGVELKKLCSGLNSLGFELFSLSTMHADLKIPANYNFVPGFQFRERTRHASLGMITGRILAEETDPDQAVTSLGMLEKIYPDSFFIPFYKGIAFMRRHESQKALDLFRQAQDIQPDNESRALCSFYSAYTLSHSQKWEKSVPFLNTAIELDPLVKEYFNLRGVALFKLDKFETAASDFQKALELDSGSATDMANLGICYHRTGRSRAAADMLTRALELDPDLSYARKTLDEIRL
ncbi:YcaO-like family protein [Desulfonatronovibrio hydrogenovorans]|nr:YcaO-like family protein [Desulfonatronovibrio hydrogenovorans]